MLELSLAQFVAPAYGVTRRSTKTYQAVAAYCTLNLIRLTACYSTAERDPQLLREIRNDIDTCIRRYHKYCIQQRAGMLAHYHEVDADQECDFEHLIPACRIRDLLLANCITVEQALNAPTVRLSRAKHAALKDAGWASKTPNMWLPFARYCQVFDAVYQTYDGVTIDPALWTLDDHFGYFKHLTIEQS